MPTLSVEKRKSVGAGSPALRRAGFIPAVVYGAHQESTPITVNAREFEKVFKQSGEASIVTLSGLGEDLPTLVHEVDVDPITSAPRHIDFYAVTKGQKVEISIPLEFIGASPAVEKGANLVKVMHELPVEADPMKLPQHIEVDLAVLKEIGDRIHASDLKLPAGVELAVPPEEVVALVQEVVEEKVEEAAPADLSAIEVEKKGKEEEAAPEGAPAAETKE